MSSVGGEAAESAAPQASSEDGFIDVGAIGDFGDRSPTRVKLGSTEVVVLRWGEEVFAFSKRCPHQGGPLCKARAMESLISPQSGELDVEDDRRVIACPWHGWAFDLREGRAVLDARMGLRMYPVQVSSTGRVLIHPRRRKQGT
jgi:3-phenylpropionate/trans-cinnamate dioxygenase ferredoxin subunit